MSDADDEQDTYTYIPQIYRKIRSRGIVITPADTPICICKENIGVSIVVAILIILFIISRFYV